MNSPVTGGLRNVVRGRARYTIAISSTVKPILCICIVRKGSRDPVAETSHCTLKTKILITEFKTLGHGYRQIWIVRMSTIYIVLFMLAQ